MDGPAEYDDRYLAGFLFYNRADYFAAHEVWESLWMEAGPAERRFVQALIQASVSLYHLTRGNRTGAERLFASGRRYMMPYGIAHRGLLIEPFWADVRAVLDSRIERPREVRLHPPPSAWPDADAVLRTIETSEAGHE